MTKKIIKLISKHDKIALFHHVNIDGDSLSSSYGLLLALKAKYPNKEIKWVAEQDYIEKRFGYMNVDFSNVISSIDESWLAIVGDVSGKERIYNGEEYLKAKNRICFDHHRNTIDHEANIFWHEPTYPASAIQAYEIAKALKIKFTEEIATALVFGILTDTNRFQYSLANIKPIEATVELFKHISNQKIDNIYQKMAEKSAADLKFQGHVLSNFIVKNKVAYFVVDKTVQKKFKLEPEDCARVNYLANIEGVKAWLFFIQYKDFVRVEYRSLGTPVNEVAASFGGGGHIRAAGCKLEKMEDHTKVVKATIDAVKKFEK